MSDTIQIKSSKLTYKTEEGTRRVLSASHLDRMFQSEFSLPILLGGRALPDGIRFIIQGDKDSPLIVVHETPPTVRRLRWDYSFVRIAIPYTIIIARFHHKNGSLRLDSNKVEIYFRNAPLNSLTDKLFYPTLLNVGRVWAFNRVKTYICALGYRCPGPNWDEQLGAYLSYFWGSGFNTSLGFPLNVKQIPNIRDWEQRTIKNPNFILSVPWESTKFTIHQAINAIKIENKKNTGSITGSVTGRFGNFMLKRKKQ